jgi:hypothetical protein
MGADHGAHQKSGTTNTPFQAISEQVLIGEVFNFGRLELHPLMNDIYSALCRASSSRKKCFTIASIVPLATHRSIAAPLRVCIACVWSPSILEPDMPVTGVVSRDVA